MSEILVAVAVALVAIFPMSCGELPPSRLPNNHPTVIFAVCGTVVSFILLAQAFLLALLGRP